jgi:hypothetical protein
MGASSQALVQQWIAAFKVDYPNITVIEEKVANELEHNEEVGINGGDCLFRSTANTSNNIGSAIYHSTGPYTADDYWRFLSNGWCERLFNRWRRRRFWRNIR